MLYIFDRYICFYFLVRILQRYKIRRIVFENGIIKQFLYRFALEVERLMSQSSLLNTIGIVAPGKHRSFSARVATGAFVQQNATRYETLLILRTQVYISLSLFHPISATSRTEIQRLDVCFIFIPRIPAIALAELFLSALLFVPLFFFLRLRQYRDAVLSGLSPPVLLPLSRGLVKKIAVVTPSIGVYSIDRTFI